MVFGTMTSNTWYLDPLGKKGASTHNWRLSRASGSFTSTVISFLCSCRWHAQGFQKALVKEYTSNHIGILIIIRGILLNEGLLEDLAGSLEGVTGFIRILNEGPIPGASADCCDTVILGFFYFVPLIEALPSGTNLTPVWV